jgi:hypothetical protein
LKFDLHLHDSPPDAASGAGCPACRAEIRLGFPFAFLFAPRFLLQRNLMGLAMP